MIYLNAQVVNSSFNDDTFWRWIHRELPNDTIIAPPPDELNPEDVVLHYSTMGTPKHPEHTIALLWELYPDMKDKLGSNVWDYILDEIDKCKTAARKTVTTDLMRPYYAEFGLIHKLPIGIDTDLFKPAVDKNALRAKYGIPLGASVGFYCGTSHPMKGADLAKQYFVEHPDVFPLLVWKSPYERYPISGGKQFCAIQQSQLAELMGCSDFFLCCGRLLPFFLVEWEALAANLPAVVIGGVGRDFVPGQNPRDQIFDKGWDRDSALVTWIDYINDLIDDNTDGEGPFIDGGSQKIKKVKDA